MAGVRTRQPNQLFHDARAEDLAVMPADRSAPITEEERAYWAARPTDDRCVELWGFLVRRAISEARTERDEAAFFFVAEALGLDPAVLLWTAARKGGVPRRSSPAA